VNGESDKYTIALIISQHTNRSIMADSFLYHQSNLETKIRTNYGGKGELFARFKTMSYDPYRDAQLAITGINKESTLQKIALLNSYYKQVELFNEGGWIKSQSKFRPTILEEFCGFLFKDLPKVKDLQLGFYNKKIFSGVTINNEGRAVIKTKDIDFCIGKHFVVLFEEQLEDIIIPVIAIECKTYTDKTMLNEAQFAAQKLKQGSPNTKVYILSEGNQVDSNEIPLKGQTPLDQIFILSKLKERKLWHSKNRKEWEDLNCDAILQFFDQVVSDLEIVLAEKQIPEIGKILLD
jgi:hypothetical protein